MVDAKSSAHHGGCPPPAAAGLAYVSQYLVRETIAGPAGADIIRPKPSPPPRWGEGGWPKARRMRGSLVPTPGCPLAGRACPAGAPISSRRNGGKEGSGASPPEPPKRGLMAAVGCVWLAKTRRALPPALSALTSQALPRPGWHASGLPCKPRKLLRCTNLARRAAVGAVPLKYQGSRGNCPWGATTRRALGGSPADRRPQVAPTSSAQAADHSLPRKRESSFPPLGLLLPTPTTSLGRRGGPIGFTESSRPTRPAVSGTNGRMISAPTGTTVTAPGRAGRSAKLHAVLHAHGLDAGQGRPKAARRFGNPTSFSRWGN